MVGPRGVRQRRTEVSEVRERIVEEVLAVLQQVVLDAGVGFGHGRVERLKRFEGTNRLTYR